MAFKAGKIMTATLLSGAALAACSSQSPADVCVDGVMTDYKVAISRSENPSSVTEGLLEENHAKMRVSRGFKECVIRYGTPGDRALNEFRDFMIEEGMATKEALF